jgi:hypothetical protein
VGLPLRGVRVFRHFAWLEVGSGKTALSHPSRQQVTQTISPLPSREFLEVFSKESICSDQKVKIHYKRI